MRNTIILTLIFSFYLTSLNAHMLDDHSIQGTCKNGKFIAKEKVQRQRLETLVVQHGYSCDPYYERGYINLVSNDNCYNGHQNRFHNNYSYGYYQSANFIHNIGPFYHHGSVTHSHRHGHFESCAHCDEVVYTHHR